MYQVKTKCMKVIEDLAKVKTVRNRSQLARMLLNTTKPFMDTQVGLWVKTVAIYG